LLLWALIAFIRTTGDRNWRGTLLLFSPRWPALLPLIILGPLAIWGNRRMLIVLGLASVTAIFPLMGFCVGSHRFTGTGASGMPMRVVAFNVHQGYLNDPAVARFLSDIHPDVVALEELPITYDHRLFPRGTWHVIQHDELCLASRYPIVSAQDIWTNLATRFTLKTPSGPVDFIVVHLSSPHYALRDAVQGMDRGSEELSLNIHQRSMEASLLGQLAARSTRPLIIAGDFNLVWDSPLFTSQFPGMTDSFESAGLGFGWTYSNTWTSVGCGFEGSIIVAFPDRIANNNYRLIAAIHYDHSRVFVLRIFDHQEYDRNYWKDEL